MGALGEGIRRGFFSYAVEKRPDAVQDLPAPGQPLGDLVQINQSFQRPTALAALPGGNIGKIHPGNAKPCLPAQTLKTPVGQQFSMRRITTMAAHIGIDPSFR